MTHQLHLCQIPIKSAIIVNITLSYIHKQKCTCNSSRHQHEWCATAAVDSIKHWDYKHLKQITRKLIQHITRKIVMLHKKAIKTQQTNNMQNSSPVWSCKLMKSEQFKPYFWKYPHQYQLLRLLLANLPVVSQLICCAYVPTLLTTKYVTEFSFVVTCKQNIIYLFL